MRLGVPIVDSPHRLRRADRHPDGARARANAPARASASRRTLFDAALSLLVPHAANWFYSGRAPRPARQRPSQHRARTTSSRRATARSFSASSTTASFAASARRWSAIDLLRRSALPDQCRAARRHVAALRAELEQTLAAFKVRRSLPRPDARRRSRGTRQHRSAGVRAGACRASRHARRSDGHRGVRHSRETCANAAQPGAAAAALRRACERDSRGGRLRSRGDRRLDRGRHRRAATERKRPTIRSPSRRRSKRSSGEETSMLKSVKWAAALLALLCELRKRCAELSDQDRSGSSSPIRRDKAPTLRRATSPSNCRRTLGQRFYIENKPGAGGNIGTEAGSARGRRRLHADDGHQCHPRHQPVPVRIAALRAGQGFRADHPDRQASRW